MCVLPVAHLRGWRYSSQSTSQNGHMQGSYAMGYNLAIEYLADFEKTWMLDSFKELDTRVLQPQHKSLKEWLFLEVHEAACCAVQTWAVYAVDA